MWHEMKYINIESKYSRKIKTEKCWFKKVKLETSSSA
jgi:hypothetical protein